MTHTRAPFTDRFASDNLKPTALWMPGEEAASIIASVLDAEHVNAGSLLTLDHLLDMQIGDTRPSSNDPTKLILKVQDWSSARFSMQRVSGLHWIVERIS